LTNILFRLVEPCNGSIIIDGIDVSTIGLRSLRQAIAIIPQDPMLFSGTIRSNLDPFSMYNDRELFIALDRVHLKKYVEAQPLALSAPIAESMHSSSSSISYMNYIMMHM
jgi:ABC-type multidrug transport system fused ATPase/permease subunit